MNNSVLKQYFPVLRTRQEALQEISRNPRLAAMFKSWEKHRQEEFLNFCSGARGCKVLYDSFFKQVMNPEKNPERLEHFLSLLLKKEVRILQVLPNESRMTAEASLLIMDIIVKMEDGSIADVEMQKIGYAFPGQRSSCYSADLLLRQYQRVKTDMAARKETFSYRYIKDVYTIVLFEKSPSECKEFPDSYIHHGYVRFDTGLNVHMPQEFIYVPLDIFRRILQNRGITDNLDAWLTFLCEDDPEMIDLLIRNFPYFKPLYDDVYKLCENMEDIMSYYSDALQEMDRNTVQYMIEEQQDKIEEQQTMLEEKQKAIEELEEERERDKARIAELEKQIAGGCYDQDI
ncbi:MAG: Rpn family recombination-promoting nuclease/putative transposase [Lachnospiraceae bacterium]|nr:Rpn family recombination-promoting nuclease/putative transposase [Lachnospiraceae bacterium]